MEFHTPQYLSLGSFRPICNKERQVLAILHSFLRAKKVRRQEQLSFTRYIWHTHPISNRKNLPENWLMFRLPWDTTNPWFGTTYCIQHGVWAFRIISSTILAIQCTCYIHRLHELRIRPMLGLVCHHLLGWYFDLYIWQTRTFKARKESYWDM